MKTCPYMQGRLRSIFSLTVALLLATACSMVQPTTAPLGTEQNPVKLALAPASEPRKAVAAGEPLTKLLERETGLHVKVATPTSYAAVIEAMGTHNVDVGWLSPLAYVLAHDRIGAEALLAGTRDGGVTSTGQIVVRADSGITTLAGLRDRRFAYVAATSPFGNLYPKAMLEAQGFDTDTFFKETIFAGGHDAVILAVYNRQVDGGATFGARVPGARTDARVTVQARLPDVFEQVRVIARTDPVPNDTVSIRKGISPNVVAQIRDGLQRLAADPAGAQTLRDLYGFDGLAPVADADFQSVRDAVRLLGLNLDTELAPRGLSTVR